MKHEIMDHNPTPGGVDPTSMALLVGTIFFNLVNFLLNAPDVLSKIAVVIAMLAGLSSLFYNVIKIRQEFKKKNKNG